jgi:hypothetical protein
VEHMETRQKVSATRWNTAPCCLVFMLGTMPTATVGRESCSSHGCIQSQQLLYACHQIMEDHMP